MRGGQQRGPINGLDPLIYTGGLPNMVIMPRRPTVKDFEGFFLGHWWMIPKTNDGSTPTEEIWILVGKQQHIATWKRLHGGSGPVVDIIVGNQYFTTTGGGTYTPTTGMKQVIVECIGAGGGSSGQCGGGGGGYTRKLYTAAQIGTSQPYFIGAGGALGSGGSSGTAGQDTTFGSGSTLITATGGSGGSGAGYIVSGGTGSGGDLNIPGGNGVGKMNSNSEELGNQSRWGGGSMYASPNCTQGKDPGGSVSGTVGNVYGGAGTPGLGEFIGSTGAAGAQGLIVVTEYFA